MEGLRSYPEEPEPQRWYSGGYPASGYDADGDGRHAEDSYRVPEPRSASPAESRYPQPGPEDLPGAGERYTDREPRWNARATEVSVDAIRPPAAAEPVAPRSLGNSDAGRTYGEPARGSERAAVVDAPTGVMPPVGRPGEAVPTDDPGRIGGVPRFHAEPIDRAALRRPAVPTPPAGDGVYRTRRPAVAVAFALLVLVFQVAALVMVADAITADPVSVPGVVAGILLIPGLPVFAAGLYGLVTGGRPVDRQDWLRPPLGYLTVGLALLIAAAIAAG